MKTIINEVARMPTKMKKTEKLIIKIIKKYLNYKNLKYIIWS